MLRQAAYLEGKGLDEMGVALLARRTNTPREVELNCLRVLNLVPEIERHVGGASNALQLSGISVAFILLWRETKSNVRRPASGLLGSFRQRCTCRQSHCQLQTRATLRQRVCGGERA